MRILWALLWCSAEALLCKVLRKNLCQLRNQLTEVFRGFCLMVSDALGMLLVHRVVYWILLMWIAVGEGLMRVVFEE